MPTIPSRDRIEIIDEIRRYARERLTAEQQRLFETFVGQYYRHVAREDLGARHVHDLYGTAMSHLTLGLDRPPGEPAVHVYSPDFEEHGFGSPHTVVDIVTDDIPFVVDSVTTEVIRHGLGLHLTVHPVVPVRRDGGTLVDILDRHDPASGTAAESFVHLEVDRQTGAGVVDELTRDVHRVLGDVRAAVEDWSAMREQALVVAETVDTGASTFGEEDRKEAAALLRWLADDHFTFLGYREYELGTQDGEDTLSAVPGTGLGLLRDGRGRPVSHSFAKLPPEVRQKAREPGLLNLTKANSRSTVHKPKYLDYVGVKVLSPEGDAVGERRFLGLMASAAYRQSPRDIPVLRRKVQSVLDRAGFPPDSFDGRMLLNILESYPREELFQIEAGELYEAATAILDIQDRQRLRLLVRRDPFGRFMSCLVYLPRDRLTTALRTRIEGILRAAFEGVSTQYATQVSESVLARLHITVQTEPGAVPEYDVAGIEARLVAAMRSWSDDLYDALVDQLGEERGVQLHGRYADAFPAAYQHDTSAAAAVVDIGRMEGLGAGDDLAMHLYRPLEAAPGTLRFKLFRHGQSVTLSDVLPLLENMGVHVVDERPYEVRPAGAAPVWIYDFGLRHDQLPDLDAEGMRERFESAFAMVWRGDLENDGLNRLVLRAGLGGREVAVVRAYAKYLRQVGATFALDYTVATLANNPSLARRLFELFQVRLDPDAAADRDLVAKHMVHDFEGGLDAVTSLNEDRVLRTLLRIVEATLRTNYFQLGPDGAAKPWLAIKLSPAQIPDLPLPRPMFEVFVYSPRVEGVHLRGGPVARGGLRWSDRPEDFRTEVLGLMKAQTVKNAVIVPVGAKGGFVVKNPPRDRDGLQAEVVACYSTFIRGLLDVTDNLVAGEVVPPRRVVRYDEDDAYLVVAADKGTATFSDIANGISQEYGFWLGDAFASGGSAGYDHKAMGITARGAWISVQRHFLDLGVDVQNDDVTVAGIGDMSGDVFGNGMLLSRHIRLVAAFDHRHVFLDPDPDAATSFEERSRLLRLPGSSWADYDASLISAGGGVHPRTAKTVPLSPEVRARLDVSEEELHAGRAHPRHPQGAGRPAVERRCRHLRQGLGGDPCRRGGQAQRPAARRRRTAALPGRRGGRQPRPHPARPGRVRAARRADQHRRDRQLRRRGLLRPRGQHQDPARSRGRRRRPHGQATGCPPGGDDRRGGRARARRQRRADPRAVQRASAGAPPPGRARAIPESARAFRAAQPGTGVPADGRRTGRAPSRDRAGHARVRGPDGLLQDLDLRRAARLRAARRRVLVRGAGQLLPDRPPAAVRRPAAGPPAPPRDRRDGRDERDGQPRRQHPRVPTLGGDRPPRPAHRPRAHRQLGDLRAGGAAGRDRVAARGVDGGADPALPRGADAG